MTSNNNSAYSAQTDDWSRALLIVIVLKYIFARGLMYRHYSEVLLSRFGDKSGISNEYPQYMIFYR